MSGPTILNFSDNKQVKSVKELIEFYDELVPSWVHNHVGTELLLVCDSNALMNATRLEKWLTEYDAERHFNTYPNFDRLVQHIRKETDNLHDTVKVLFTLYSKVKTLNRELVEKRKLEHQKLMSDMLNNTNPGVKKSSDGPTTPVFQEQKPRIRVTAPAPAAVFVDPDQSKVDQVIAHLKHQHPTLSSDDLDEVARFTKQLLPITVDNALSWGDRVINSQAGVTMSVASIQKTFSDMQAYELIEEVLESAKPKQSFFQKLKNNASSVQERKNAILALQLQIKPALLTTELAITTNKEAAQKLQIYQLVVSGVADALNITDESIKHTLHNKRSIMMQCLTQNKLNEAKLMDVKKQIVDVSTKIQHVLSVTIPALEMIKS